jgi:hypothetical protein
LPGFTAPRILLPPRLNRTVPGSAERDSPIHLKELEEARTELDTQIIHGRSRANLAGEVRCEVPASIELLLSSEFMESRALQQLH